MIEAQTSLWPGHVRLRVVLVRHLGHSHVPLIVRPCHLLMIQLLVLVLAIDAIPSLYQGYFLPLGLHHAETNLSAQTMASLYVALIDGSRKSLVPNMCIRTGRPYSLRMVFDRLCI